jgi:hypothetical protein
MVGLFSRTVLSPHGNEFRCTIMGYSLACTPFRRHRVRCFDGAGGGSWRDGSLRERSVLDAKKMFTRLAITTPIGPMIRKKPNCDRSRWSCSRRGRWRRTSRPQ